MSLLDYLRPTQPDADITKENAIYHNTYLVCPRCRHENPTISRVRGYRRTLSCMNCGYTGDIEDGLRIRVGIPEMDGEDIE